MYFMHALGSSHSKGEISVEFRSKDALNPGRSVSASMYNLVLDLTNKAYSIMNSVVRRNQVFILDRALKSYHFFKASIEGHVSQHSS